LETSTDRPAKQENNIILTKRPNGICANGNIRANAVSNYFGKVGVLSWLPLGGEEIKKNGKTALISTLQFLSNPTATKEIWTNFTHKPFKNFANVKG
jgi:hypothetical protein